LDVAAAVGTGIILPSGRTGVSCDVNSSSDNTIPAETFTAADGADPLELSPSGGGLGFDDSAPTGDTGNADDGLDAGGFPPNTVFPGGTPPGIGSALYPFDGATGPCGAGNVESITWYKDGVKIATVTYSGGTYTYAAEPGQYMPAWVSTVSATPGVLVAGADGAGTYTSITKCADGSQYGKSTVVGSTTLYSPAVPCSSTRLRFKMSNSATIFGINNLRSVFVEQTDPTVNVVRGIDCSGNVTNAWGIISWNPQTDPDVSLGLIGIQVNDPTFGWIDYVDYTIAP
jgi:hypothetical protein